MAKRSIQLNQLEDKFKILKEDIKNLNNYFEKNTFDVIVTNPPYKKKDTGIQNEEQKKMIAKHETTATLEDFIKTTNYLLKDKGELYMIHRPERLVDILSLMRNYKIEPKILRFVFGSQKSEPKLILIKGIKNANPILKVEKNLYIYKESGEYTEEIYQIYND